MGQDQERAACAPPTLAFQDIPVSRAQIYGDICVDFRELVTAVRQQGTGGAKVGEKHGNGNGRVPVRR
jgi:hypothetical protein